MLTLARKKGEGLIINGEIKIRILEVQGDKVKIGIEAPKEVPIYREEIYIQIQESNHEASKGLDKDTAKDLFELLKDKI